jgi:hypothetical protein
MYLRNVAACFGYVLWLFSSLSGYFTLQYHTVTQVLKILMLLSSYTFKIIGFGSSYEEEYMVASNCSMPVFVLQCPPLQIKVIFYLQFSSPIGVYLCQHYCIKAESSHNFSNSYSACFVKEKNLEYPLQLYIVFDDEYINE